MACPSAHTVGAEHTNDEDECEWPVTMADIQPRIVRPRPIPFVFFKHGTSLENPSEEGLLLLQLFNRLTTVWIIRLSVEWNEVVYTEGFPSEIFTREVGTRPEYAFCNSRGSVPDHFGNRDFNTIHHPEDFGWFASHFSSTDFVRTLPGEGEIPTVVVVTE